MIWLAIAAVWLVSPAAFAAPTIEVGMTIYGRDGEIVGKIQRVEGDAAVVDTGSQKITLGLKSFRTGAQGPLISMTRSELQAAANEVQQSGDNAVMTLLTPGANVYDPNGAIAATVDSLQGKDVIISVGTRKARLPVSAFRKTARGPTIDKTAAELETAMAAQVPPSAPPPPGPQKQ